MRRVPQSTQKVVARGPQEAKSANSLSTVYNLRDRYDSTEPIQEEGFHEFTNQADELRRQALMNGNIQ